MSRRDTTRFAGTARARALRALAVSAIAGTTVVATTAHAEGTPPASSAAPAPAAVRPVTPAPPRRVPTKPKAAARRVTRKTETAPPGPPPPTLKLTVDAPGPDASWTVRVENTGAVPVRIVADARVLALDIQEEGADEDASPRKGHASHGVRCELPADMRPSDLDERTVVLPTGRSYAEKIDPRLFCFGAHDAAALVAGAKVTPHLVGTRDVPVVRPVEQVEPAVGSVADLAGDVATIGPAATAAAPSKESPAGEGLVVTTPPFADYGVGWEAEVTVTVTNRSRETIPFLLRPETIVLDVTGPSGVGVTDPSPVVHCAWPGSPPPAIYEMFTRLAHNESSSVTVLLSALCPDGALQRPGLYVVHASLDTRAAGGGATGVKAFAGKVLGASTTRLRVREWNGVPPTLARPQLVEQASLGH
jgi:hypothetical protein